VLRGAWFALLAVIVGCSAPPPPLATPTLGPAATPVHAEAVSTLQSGPVQTQLAVAAATSIARSTVQISDASVDQINVENSSVSLKNVGTEPVDLSGWVLFVGSYRITFPTSNYMTLAPASTKIVHLSSSTAPTSGDNLYLGLGAVSVGSGHVTSGDELVLLDSEGNVASIFQLP
jgi:hypothetical protein